MDKAIELTEKGKEKLLAELADYRGVRRPAVIDRIKKAKEFGDLSENAEYEDARNEQSFVEGRIQELEYMLKNGKMSRKNSGVVSIGNIVKIKLNGEATDFELVGINESDPASGKISNESPIGRALIGKKIGDKISAQTPSGELKLEIISVE